MPQKMERKRLFLTSGEILIVSLLIAGINLIFPENPGFYQLYYIPYIAVGLLFSAVYGAVFGLICLAFCTGLILGPLPFLLSVIHDDFVRSGYWSLIARNAVVPFPVAVVTTYIFGAVRSATGSREVRLKRRLEELVKENWVLKKKSDSLFRVNLELDERVSRQQEAITSLYTQLQKLDTLDVNQALNVLLETVQIFTKATKASIWEFVAGMNQFKLSASLGWNPETDRITSIPVENSIEGWAFRNDSLFSVRMVLQYDNLKKMENGRNLITLPITVGRKTWGVLNIEEMPFEKYNMYTERLLYIIINLAEHSIEKAIAYESVIEKDEVDDVTGLPLYSQLYRMLEEETRRAGVDKGNFSLIVVDTINYTELVQTHGGNPVREVIKAAVEELEALSEHKAHFYKYKEDSQIACIYPNLDFDGVSLFCLEALEKLNTGKWQIDGNDVPLEAVIGFSVFSGEGQGPEQMLEQAENLLEMQKV